MSTADKVETGRKRLPQPSPRLLVPDFPRTVIDFMSKDGRPFTVRELYVSTTEDLIEKMVNGGDKPLSHHPKGPIKLDIAWPGYRHKIEVGSAGYKLDITRAELAIKLANRVCNYMYLLFHTEAPDSEWKVDMDSSRVYVASLWEFRTRWYRAELEIAPPKPKPPMWVEVYRSP